MPPILLVRIDDVTDIELIRQLLHAFEDWKTKRLKVDLVILNDRASSYAQDLQGTIEALVRKISAPRTAGGPGNMGKSSRCGPICYRKKRAGASRSGAGGAIWPPGRSRDQLPRLRRHLLFRPSSRANRFVCCHRRSPGKSAPAILSSSMALGDFPQTGVNMSRFSRPTGQPLLHGSMSSQIQPLDFNAPLMAAVTPGLDAAGRTRPRVGAMIPSATVSARQSIFRMKKTGF